MIKENELRLGNLFEYEGKFIEVNDISYMIDIDDNWEGWVMDGIKLSEANPIPLTPEILEKAGFEKKISWNDTLFWENPKMLGAVCKNRDGFNIEDIESGDICNKDFNYVHQLQNIYFALTGEELNISL